MSEFDYLSYTLQTIKTVDIKYIQKDQTGKYRARYIVQLDCPYVSISHIDDFG